MAMKHWQSVGLGQRMAARVLTVDKPRRRLEAALKDGGMVYVSIMMVGPLFRMPKEGEIWWIRKDGGIWELDAPLDLAIQSRTGEDEGDEFVQIEDLPEGQVRIDADPSETGSGIWVRNSEVVTQSDLRNELGYAEITANATASSTTPDDVVGFSITVTIRPNPVIVTFDCAAIKNSNANGGVRIDILEDGVGVGRVSSLINSADAAMGAHREIRRNPLVGDHTYKIQLATLFSGTATISADNSGVGPAYLAVREVV